MISIIIPSKTDAYVDRLLRSIFSLQPDWKEKAAIFVADDGISDGCKAKYPDVTFVKCDKPFIFARNVNTAVAAALALYPESDLLLQNDDTEFRSPRFLDEFEKLMLKIREEKWAVVSPQILRNSGNTQIMEPTPGGSLMETYCETVPFISVLLSNDSWRNFGPLDERFTGYGWEDNAYCFKARQNNWKLGWTSVVKVDHEWHGSFRKYSVQQLDKMSNEARDVFFRHYPHPMSKTYKAS